MLSAVLAFFINAAEGLVNALKLVFCPEAWGNPAVVVIGFWGAVIWLGSGFFAATVAELSGNPVARHFFLALLAPYFYPVYLMGHIRRREAAAEVATDERRDLAKAAASNRFKYSRAERLAEKKGISVEAALAELDGASGEAEEPEGGIPVAEDGGFTMDSFDALPVDENGLRPGPFLISAKDGRTFHVDCIKAAQADVLIMVCDGKTIRIKYPEIADFQNI